MRRSRASTTAQIMVLHRAMEAMRPSPERVCDDPYAFYFLSSRQAKRLKCPLRLAIGRWLMSRIFPGVHGAIVARVRFIDEYLAACLDQGLEQLVILGAGYDTRAYRFKALENKAIVFEVDHPATQQVKREKLRLIFNGSPQHVVFVPMDLEADPLSEKLFENGYDHRKKTLFILEGLIMYLTPKVVDGILNFIATHTGRGSAVVFDCLPASVIDGTHQARESRAMYRYARRKGEPFTFGLNPEELKAFLEARNFNHIHQVNAVQCQPNYFNGQGCQRRVSAVFFFVRASIRRCGSGLGFEHQ